MKCQNILLFVTVFEISVVSGQLTTKESFFNISECDVHNVTINCGPGAIIAPQRLDYGYRQTCSQSCCQYDPGDCLVEEDNKEGFIRICSGQSSCNVPTQASLDFCSFGIQTASYVYVEYYCIPESNRISICSNGTISSTGEPLFLTNDGYPDVTVGERDCTCSFEVYSCSSVSSYYIIDADLYSNTSSCYQGIKILDAGNSTIKNINCENYYSIDLREETAQTNYLRINFFSETTSNREGQFFIGFVASEQNVSFSINCTKEAPTWCLDCGLPGDITDGNISLVEPAETGYNASASVTCVTGYQSNSSQIICKEQGQWQDAECYIKDCGSPPLINNGNVTLIEENVTTYGSRASLVCDTGYKTQISVIECLASGFWENAECTLIDCGPPPTVDHGTILLDPASNYTTFGSNASVMCATGHEPATAIISCRSDGFWEPINCSAIDCGQPPNITHGSIILHDPINTTYMATANLTCDSGYNGDAVIVYCNDKSSWDQAHCIIKDCGQPSDIAYGSIILTDPSTTTYRATATLTCDSGYISNVSIVYCQDSGFWDQAVCIKSEVPADDKSSANVVVAVVLSLIIVALLLCVQYTIHCCFLYTKYSTEREKKIGSLPLIGLPFVLIKWVKMQYKRYHVNLQNEGKQLQAERKENKFHIKERYSSTSDLAQYTSSAYERSTGNTGINEDMGPTRDKAVSEHSFAHHDDIELTEHASEERGQVMGNTVQSTEGRQQDRSDSCNRSEVKQVMPQQLSNADHSAALTQIEPENREVDNKVEQNQQATSNSGLTSESLSQETSSVVRSVAERQQRMANLYRALNAREAIYDEKSHGTSGLSMVLQSSDDLVSIGNPRHPLHTHPT